MERGGKRGDAMPVSSDNLNLNLNLNLGASPAGGAAATGYGRPRFNTEDMDKLAPAPFPSVLKLPKKRYSENWDPDLRAWAYLQDFIVEGRWGSQRTPVDFVYNEINRQNVFPVPNTPGARYPLDEAGMANEVLSVLNASLDRADRAMEILDQASAVGALNYWTGLLRIDPSQDRNTFLLMLVARKIGEYVAMGLKNRYLMRRPSQVYSLILPLLDPPDTPSFPSSHSLQAHLISGLIELALGRGHQVTVLALRHLAGRVARNREVGGVHYPMDSMAGAFGAALCRDKLSRLDPRGRFWSLVRAARSELSDLP